MSFNRIPAKHNPFGSADIVSLADFVIGAEDANAIGVSIQLKNANNEDVFQRVSVDIYLSDDANGDSIVATGITTLASGTDGFVDVRTAGKSAKCVSEVDGDLDLVLTFSGGAKTVYLVIIMPDGSLVVSSAITWA